jgi:hypothetical protein
VGRSGWDLTRKAGVPGFRDDAAPNRARLCCGELCWTVLELKLKLPLQPVAPPAAGGVKAVGMNRDMCER